MPRNILPEAINFLRYPADPYAQIVSLISLVPSEIYKKETLYGREGGGGRQDYHRLEKCGRNLLQAYKKGCYSWPARITCFLSIVLGGGGGGRGF